MEQPVPRLHDFAESNPMRRILHSSLIRELARLPSTKITKTEGLVQSRGTARRLKRTSRRNFRRRECSRAFTWNEVHKSILRLPPPLAFFPPEFRPVSRKVPERRRRRPVGVRARSSREHRRSHSSRIDSVRAATRTAFHHLKSVQSDPVHRRGEK